MKHSVGMRDWKSEFACWLFLFLCVALPHWPIVASPISMSVSLITSSVFLFNLHKENTIPPPTEKQNSFPNVWLDWHFQGLHLHASVSHDVPTGNCKNNKQHQHIQKKNRLHFSFSGNGGRAFVTNPYDGTTPTAVGNERCTGHVVTLKWRMWEGVSRNRETDRWNPPSRAKCRVRFGALRTIVGGIKQERNMGRMSVFVCVCAGISWMMSLKKNCANPVLSNEQRQRISNAVIWTLFPLWCHGKLGTFRWLGRRFFW